MSQNMYIYNGEEYPPTFIDEKQNNLKSIAVANGNAYEKSQFANGHVYDNKAAVFEETTPTRKSSSSSDSTNDEAQNTYL